jgi:hypothetical protein
MAIDIDPATLEAVAAASASAYDKAITHVREEIKARDPENLDALVATLADEGPYAYTILPQIAADGTVRLPILTTKEEITEAYAFIRGVSDLHEVIGLTEVRGSWYLFQHNMTRGSLKGDTVNINNRETLSLFPSGGGPGITGELVWLRVPRSQLGAPDEVDATPADPLLARHAVHEQHHRHLDALRANDLDAILDGVHDLAASAVRDYVGDTGTLVELADKDAHREWYGAFFDRYEVRSVQPLCQTLDDWYAFSELRLTVAPRGGTGTLTFHTAEFAVVAKDGRFIARIGHGTEPT